VPDRLDNLMNRLYQDTDQLDWTGTDLVRARGRSRTRHQRTLAILATAASVGLVATGAFALAGTNGSAPINPLGTTATPGPTLTEIRTIPPAAMLQPADIGAGVVASEPLSNDGAYAAWLSNCPQAGTWTTITSIGSRHVGLSTGDSDPRSVVEHVTAVPSGSAGRYLDDLVAATATCADHRQYSDNRPVRLSVVGQEFAGERSVLIRIEAPDRVVIKAFVVRANLIAEVERRGADVAATRALGVTAAARLCGAGLPC